MFDAMHMLHTSPFSIFLARENGSVRYVPSQEATHALIFTGPRVERPIPVWLVATRSETFLSCFGIPSRFDAWCGHGLLAYFSLTTWDLVEYRDRPVDELYPAMLAEVLARVAPKVPEPCCARTGVPASAVRPGEVIRLPILEGR